MQQELGLYLTLSQKLGKQGRIAQSYEMANKGLQKSINFLGKNHFMTALFYGMIGGCYTQTKEWQKSLQMHQKSLKIKLSQKILNNVAIATTRDSIARAYRLKGQFKKSEQLYLELIQFEKKNLKKEQRQQTALTLVNLGGLYMELQRIPEGIKLYEEAIEIADKQLGKNNYISPVAKNNLKLVKQKYPDYEEDEQILKDSKFWKSQKLQFDIQPWKEVGQFLFQGNKIQKLFTQGDSYLIDQIPLPNKINQLLQIKIKFLQLTKYSFSIGLATSKSIKNAEWTTTKQYLGLSANQKGSIIWNSMKTQQIKDTFKSGDQLLLIVYKHKVTFFKNDIKLKQKMMNQIMKLNPLHLILEIHNEKDEIEHQILRKICQPLNNCVCCKKSNKNLLLCGKCKKVKYCGRECQVSDWGNHKLNCKI